MTPLMQQGELPKLGALREAGVSGILHSTVPPMSPLAWTSIATGVNPGKHGIYDFVAQDRDTYCIAPTSYRQMKHPAIWDLLNMHHKKIGVVNFPTAFPPPEVESFFVSGFGAPESGAYAYPPSLHKKLTARGYRIHPQFGPGNGARRYLTEVIGLMELQCEIALELMREWEWDLFWMVFQGLDWIQHYLWNDTIGGEDAVKAAYSSLDSIVGRLLLESDDDWNVVVLSDHGFREIRAELHLNSLLEKWGYLKRRENFARGTLERLYHSVLDAGWAVGRGLPFDAKQWLWQHFPRGVRAEIRALTNEQHRLHTMIDWSRTEAFSFGYMGSIYVHEKGKYPQGRVVAGSESRLLREEIAARLRALRHPETGDPIVGQIFYKEDVYSGHQLQSAPDILFQPFDFAYMVYGDFGRDWFGLPQTRVADHDMHGILIMRGKHVRSGAVIDADVVDITPTLLYLNDLPISADMDGRVLDEALVEGLVRGRPVRMIDVEAPSAELEHAYGKAEQLEVEERLRALGYM
jgi:predicted AlkP superfamily phosphohydrolase/phosphomutase